MECWNDFCISTDCDGENHVDTTGDSWRQARGEVYCPSEADYLPPHDHYEEN